MRSDAHSTDRPSWFLRLAAWGGLVFLHFPILVILLYAFNTEESAYSFPLQGFTLKWFSIAFSNAATSFSSNQPSTPVAAGKSTISAIASSSRPPRLDLEPKFRKAPPELRVQANTESAKGETRCARPLRRGS